MKIAIHMGRSEWQRQWCQAFAFGLRRHGIQAKVIGCRHPAYAEPVECDLAVFWGHRAKDVIRAQRRAGKHYLVLERGHLGGLEERRNWCSAGFNGLGGRAAYPKAQDGGARWERLWSYLMKPWRQEPPLEAAPVVIMGQMKGDQALAGADIDQWYREAARVIREHHGIEPAFRPHPLGVQEAPEGVPLFAGSLADALAAARAVVTLNSTVGVDAAVAGVPVTVCDEGAMAWPVAALGLEAEPVTPDREAWAHDLAWCQWSEEEMRRGEAWEALRGLVEVA